MTKIFFSMKTGHSDNVERIYVYVAF